MYGWRHSCSMPPDMKSPGTRATKSPASIASSPVIRMEIELNFRDRILPALRMPLVLIEPATFAIRRCLHHYGARLRPPNIRDSVVSRTRRPRVAPHVHGSQGSWEKSEHRVMIDVRPWLSRWKGARS